MGKHEVKTEWTSRLRYTIVHEVGQVLNSEMNTEKKSLSNAEKMKMWREEKIKKKKRQTKSTMSLILNVKLPKSRKIEISKNCPMLHWCTCVSFYKSEAKLICTDLPLSYVGLMTGSWKFLTAHKILPLLNLLTKFKWVLACSCSPNFCSCSQAGFLVSIAGFQCRETHKH